MNHERRAWCRPALIRPAPVHCGWLALLVLVLLLLLLLLAACGSAATETPERRMPERERGAMANSAVMTDFATLVPSRHPNKWLIAPVSFGPATPDEAAPTLPVPAARLAELWVGIIKEQPRTRILGVSEDGLQIEAEQDSAVFGFTDRISVRILPVDAGRSTLVAYSRAQSGYWDLGVNRTRLRKWIATLQARAGGL